MDALNVVAEGTGQLFATHGLIAVFLIVLVKGIGVPVPVPSEGVLLLAASQVAAGTLGLWETLGLALAASVVGGSVQYLLIRVAGGTLLRRHGTRVGLGGPRLDRAVAAIRRGGAVAVGISMLLPPTRPVAIPASGLAALPYRSFLPGLAVGSSVSLVLIFGAVGIAGPLLEALRLLVG